MTGLSELVAVVSGKSQVLELSPALQDLPTMIAALQTQFRSIQAGETLWFDLRDQDGRRLPWYLLFSPAGVAVAPGVRLPPAFTVSPR